MEHIRDTSVVPKEKESMVEKFEKESKDLRLLSYKILVDKFNQKYSKLNESQRDLLKNYINNISNSSTLKDFISEEVANLKNKIGKILPKIDDKVVSIKLKECLNVLEKLNKGNVVNEDQLVTMMRFYSLLDEVDEVIKA
jgi:glutamine synthetase adenylyltransferase